MTDQDNDWSAPPRPEDQAAPWDGREAQPVVHTAGAQGAKAALPAYAAAARPVDRRFRGRRILSRIFTLLPILVWGGLGLVVFGIETFDRRPIRYEYLSLFLPLVVAVPFFTVCLFVRPPLLRLLTVSASALTSFIAALVVAVAIVEIGSWGRRWRLDEMAGMTLVGLADLVCLTMAVWLAWLELQRLRPATRAAEHGAAWTAQTAGGVAADGLSLGAGAVAEAPPKKAGIPNTLPVRTERICRVVTSLPVVIAGGVLCYVLAFVVVSRRAQPAQITTIVGTLVLLIGLPVATWLRNAWWRTLAVGMQFTVPLVLGTCFIAVLCQEHRRLNRSWNYRPTTFGMDDPQLTAYTLWILALVLGCLVAAYAALRLLRHDLAVFQHTAAPYLQPVVRPPKEEDDLSPAGDWDSGRGR